MPEIFKIDPEDEDSLKNRSKQIKETLRQGGVIAFPTDTFYALGADPFNERGVCKIFEIKSREADQPLLVLVASIAQVKCLALDRSQEADQLMRECWPAPLTLILRAVPELPKRLTANTETIGLRLPKNDWTRRLIEVAGCPLTAPSANKSGKKNLRTADEVRRSLGDTIDLIIDAGPAPGGKVSTLLDTTVSPPVLIRQGAVTREKIESILKTVCSLGS